MKKFHVQPLYFRSLEDTILAIYDHLASYAVRSDIPSFIKDRVWKLMGHGRPGFSEGKRKKKKKKQQQPWHYTVTRKSILECTDWRG